MPGSGRRFRDTKIETAKEIRNTAWRLLSYLRPYRLMLSCVFIMALIGTLLLLLGPLLLGVAVDRFIIGHDIAGLLRMIFLMLGVYFGSWLTQTGQSLLMARVSQRAMRELRRHLFAHLQTLSLRFFDRDRHGELMSRLTNDMDAISVLLAQNVTAFFSGLLSLVGILVAMLILNPPVDIRIDGCLPVDDRNSRVYRQADSP
jgi:ATP-binding cassette subfamily B protein